VSEDWDFYFAQVDGRPASIYLDLGIAVGVPLPGYPDMAYLRVHMHQPRADGLSSQDEFDALIALEDRIVAMLTAGDAARFVGRCTSDGHRDFFFFLRPQVDWQASAATAMEGSGYAYASGQRPDPQGEVYHGFLYPDDEARERIRNRRVCAALERAGDALSAPRDIRHWAYFPDPAGRDAFLAQAAAMSFRACAQEAGSAAEEEGEYLALVQRDDIPGYDRIDAICLPLFRAAHDLGGRYDGWESEVVTAEAAR